MINNRRLIVATIFGLGWMVVVSALAPAQQLATGRTARDNNAAAGARAPDAMVTAGIARAQQATRDGRAVHQITETVDDGADGSELDLREQVTGNILTFIFNRILERLGLPPLFSDEGVDGAADDPDNTDDGDSPDGAADGTGDEPDVPASGDDTTGDSTDDDDSTGGRRPGRGGRG